MVNSVENETEKQEEAPLNGILSALLFNETFMDVQLRSFDGTVVPANRCILASRSPVFCAMLYGHFAETSSSVIDMPPTVTGKNLRSLVEYIYTDRPSLLESYKDDFDDDDDTSMSNFSSASDAALRIQDLMSLFEAAVYFTLPVLANRALHRAASVIVRHPFQALEYFMSRYPAISEVAGHQTRQIEDAHHGDEEEDAITCPFKRLCALVAVGVAAHQMDISEICSHVQFACSNPHRHYTKDRLRGSFAVLAACWPYRGDEFAAQVEQCAGQSIYLSDLNKEWDLLPFISPELVRNLIKDQRNPYSQFLVLQKWAAGENEVLTWRGVAIPSDSLCTLETDQRQGIAQELSQECLDKLEYIHQNEITKEVQESGCVSEAQIEQALQSQLSKMQTLQWHTAESVESSFSFWDRDLDRFDCPVMRSGVHYWTLKVEKCPEKLWLGIVRPDNTSWSGLWLTHSGTHQFHIGCGRGDETAIDEQISSKGFRTGSIVEFALDLREENSENGILTVSVDKKPFQTLFSNLISGPKDRVNGFWPAGKSNCIEEAAVRIVALRSE